MQSTMKPRGALVARKITQPGPGLAYRLRNLPNVWAGWWRYQVARALRVPTVYGELRARLLRADGSVVDYGMVCTRLVTTAFVNFVVDQLQTETSVFGDFKYHDSGVGTTDPDVGDTGIETTDGESRATGSQEEGASANIYKSIGTIAYTTTKAITEHGLFNDATTGTLMDRSEFAAINVVNGDSIQFTYQLTVSAGG
jgi:hypothetical protein